jgi:hypothetical protein
MSNGHATLRSCLFRSVRPIAGAARSAGPATARGDRPVRRRSGPTRDAPSLGGWRGCGDGSVGQYRQASTHVAESVDDVTLKGLGVRDRRPHVRVDRASLARCASQSSRSFVPSVCLALRPSDGRSAPEAAASDDASPAHRLVRGCGAWPPLLSGSPWLVIGLSGRRFALP